MNEYLIVLFEEKFFHRKSIGGEAFFANSNGYFSEIFFEGHSSGQTGSNDTGLEFVSCLRAEKKGGHTEKVPVQNERKKLIFEKFNFKLKFS